jgi:hypothetical protein
MAQNGGNAGNVTACFCLRHPLAHDGVL